MSTRPRLTDPVMTVNRAELAVKYLSLAVIGIIIPLFPSPTLTQTLGSTSWILGTIMCVSALGATGFLLAGRERVENWLSTVLFISLCGLASTAAFLVLDGHLDRLFLAVVLTAFLLLPGIRSVSLFSRTGSK